MAYVILRKLDHAVSAPLADKLPDAGLSRQCTVDVRGSRSFLADLVAPATNIMYTTIPHLNSAIRLSLQKGQLCRVYKESLDACWPHLSDDEQAERIAQFAMQHHWAVRFRKVGSLGTVAEFEKADSGAHVAHG